MDDIYHQAYIISDLHIGGEYGNCIKTMDRGFRMTTHMKELTDFVHFLAKKPSSKPSIELVINGDFVDFLAELNLGSVKWSGFTMDPKDAVRKFKNIYNRDKDFFEAITLFLRKGHRLVILLGNHDIELSLPDVRQQLRSLLKIDTMSNFAFYYDGEAYALGDVLIEHGNQYDSFNIVDMSGLNFIRSQMSRGKAIAGSSQFKAPVGSILVAQIINHIKIKYSFVDLLKPENEALIPLLLTLEPGYRKYIFNIIYYSIRALENKLVNNVFYPIEKIDFQSTIDDKSYRTVDFLDNDVWKVLNTVLGSDTEWFRKELNSQIRDNCDIMKYDTELFDNFDSRLSLFRLLIGQKHKNVDRRIPLLIKSLKILQNDNSYNYNVETNKNYLKAARDLISDRFNYIIFGHTHLAKKIEIANGKWYLNTGTWADLMKIPDIIYSGNREQVENNIDLFLSYIRDGNIQPWLMFKPTYIRVDFNNNMKTIIADLCTYSEIS